MLVGVLGQIGALLELAEQIQNGEVPDPEGLVVTCGSFCTFTGLLMGEFNNFENSLKLLL